MSEDTYLLIALNDINDPPTADEVAKIVKRCPEWINKVGSFNFSPLLYASRGGLTEVAKVLIDKGANVNYDGSRINGKENFGVDTVFWTPLHAAARNNNLEICRMLIEKGANINAKDKTTGCTPLHLAVLFGHLDITKLLIEKGATVDCIGTIKTDKDVSPLCTAARNGNVAIVQLLINHHANVKYRDRDGLTPLTYAVLGRNLDVLRSLIAAGAQVNCKDDTWGYTPLHYAARDNKMDAVKILLENGADVNCGNNDGRMPLHFAAEKGNLDLGEFLISKRAFVNAEDKNKKTPIMLAKENKHYGFAQMLLDHNARDI